VASDIEIRHLDEADLDAIEAREPAGQGFVRAMWRLQEEGASVLLVAWLDGEPVGSGQLDRRVSPVELKNLNVRAGFRGKGVGSALIAAAEELARDDGRLAMGVGIDNPRARELYERLGYRSTGEESTTMYDYVDEHGVTRTATEIDVLLIKEF
jgi:GNAT superfamily N-acetyltransferase